MSEYRAKSKSEMQQKITTPSSLCKVYLINKMIRQL